MRVISFLVHQLKFKNIQIQKIYRQKILIRKSDKLFENLAPFIHIYLLNIISYYNQLMTMYYRDDSYAKSQTEQLELSSKIDNKQDDESEQIAYLSEKITQMQKNYIAMEKIYSDKIKFLYSQIMEKDQQFKKLQCQMLQIKNIANDHKIKVEQLNKNSSKKSTQPKAKSKSPVLTSRPNYRTTINNAQAEQKSHSPKNQSKKMSPAPTHKNIIKRPKNTFGQTDSGSTKKNNSGEKFLKKSKEQKNINEKSKKILPKIEEVESIQIPKKVITGVNNFREKAPVFK